MPERCAGARPRVTHASVPEYLNQSSRIPAPALRSPMPRTPRRTAELMDFRHTVHRSQGHASDPRAT